MYIIFKTTVQVHFNKQYCSVLCIDGFGTIEWI